MSDLSGVKALVFDVFGTVVDWRTSLINDFTKWGETRGIKADWTAQDSIKAGATILVAGSAIFNDRESIPDAMKGMRGCILG